MRKWFLLGSQPVAPGVATPGTRSVFHPEIDMSAYELVADSFAHIRDNLQDPPNWCAWGVWFANCAIWGYVAAQFV